MTRNFLAQALDSRLAGKLASKMSKNLVKVDILPLRPLLRQLHSRTTKFRRLAKCFKNTKMQVRKEPRKLGKQTNKQANNKNHENKPKMLHSIAGQKVFYFHTFVGQNPRTITEICNLYVIFLYIYIQCAIEKRAKCWEIVAGARQEINGKGVVEVFWQIICEK